MSFATIFFGNGLGRAIDNNYFQLITGIASIWNNANAPYNGVLTNTSKSTILNSLPLLPNGNSPTIPQGEDELLVLHMILNSCSNINYYHRRPNQILTQTGISLEDTVDYFFRNIAYYFHKYNVLIPSCTNVDFVRFYGELEDFVNNNEIHIATTNYDNIIYHNFANSNFLTPTFATTKLVDGFTGRHQLVFDEDNLERKNNNNFGWYLHLHGSPLFYTDPTNGRIIKLLSQNAQGSVSNATFQGTFEHIVLNHFSVKPTIISTSNLLSVYWEYYVRALLESNRVIVFGYGGADIHINKQFEKWIVRMDGIEDCRKKLVVVYRDPQDIQWLNSLVQKHFNGRNPRWFDLRQFNNLLDFDWTV